MPYTIWMVAKLTLEQVAANFFSPHGDTYGYDLSSFTNTQTKMTMFCQIHGSFRMTPNNHRLGKGCPICGRLKRASIRSLSVSEVFSRCRNAHGDRYTYDETSYKGADKNITVFCKVHGKFEQQFQHHVKARGCPKCAVESHPGFYNTKHPERLEGKVLYLYFIKLGDCSVKIGLTKNLDDRLLSLASHSKLSASLLSAILGSANTMIELESKVKNMSSRFHNPTAHFGGHTEVFQCNRHTVSMVMDTLNQAVNDGHAELVRVDEFAITEALSKS